jgi:opacity protein-like surface antigen
MYVHTMKLRILPTIFLMLPLTCLAGKIDIYLMGGPAFSSNTNANNVRINQYMVNEYRTIAGTQTRLMPGLGIGHTFDQFAQPINISLGLSGYYSNLGKVKGREYPFIDDGVFDSLNYQFYTRSIAAMVESRLIYLFHGWQPYALIGMGAARNYLYHYSETPTIFAESAATSPYPFANHTLTSFAYELGVGVQKQIFADVKHRLQYYVSLDYRYMNLGKAELGASAVQASNDRIQITHLTTQALIFSLKLSI